MIKGRLIESGKIGLKPLQEAPSSGSEIRAREIGGASANLTRLHSSSTLVRF